MKLLFVLVGFVLAFTPSFAEVDDKITAHKADLSAYNCSTVCTAIDRDAVLESNKKAMSAAASGLFNVNIKYYLSYSANDNGAQAEFTFKSSLTNSNTGDDDTYNDYKVISDKTTYDPELLLFQGSLSVSASSSDSFKLTLNSWESDSSDVWTEHGKDEDCFGLTYTPTTSSTGFSKDWSGSCGKGTLYIDYQYYA